MKKVKLLFLAVFVILFRLIVTKDPTIINMVASGDYKAGINYLKHIVVIRNQNG